LKFEKQQQERVVCVSVNVAFC